MNPPETADGTPGNSKSASGSMNQRTGNSTQAFITQLQQMPAKYTQRAVYLFANYIKQNDRYNELRKKMRQAYLFIPYEEYVSVAFLTSIVLGIAGFLAGLLLGFVAFRGLKLPAVSVTNKQFADFLLVFSPYKIELLIALTGILSLIIIITLVYSLFLMYPSLQASIRKVRIDTQLFQVIPYMHALSRGEANIVEVMRSVAELPNVYGEVSHEFAIVLRDMELLGIDFMTALRKLQEETPSQNLAMFIGNIRTLIDNGGDIPDFLAMQIENNRLKMRSDYRLFLDMLELIAEAYVTGFVAGPLFIIIAGATIGSMQASMNLLLLVVTYAVLPFGSLLFVVLIDMMLPKDEEMIGSLKLRKASEISGITITQRPEKDEGQLHQEYEASKRRIYIENILRNPLQTFFEKPAFSFFVSVPVATIVLVYFMIAGSSMMFGGYVMASRYITDYVILSILIVLLPYIVFHEARSQKIRSLENAVPQFLKNLATINETGLPLSESLRVILRTERTALRKYIEKMFTDIYIGSSTTDAFIRFANKVRINSISRLIALITKSSEISSDMRDVLNNAYTDYFAEIQLKKDKLTNMLIYIVIIYVAFVVFLYVVYTLSTTFIPEMAKAGKASGGTFVQSFDPAFFGIYFYHTALIQGFFSGIMAGVMGEGDLRSGLKHSVIMILIAFAVFKFMV